MKCEVIWNRSIEQKFILMLCFLSMLKVFMFSAAFPLFGPVDEIHHIDTVIKHAKGYAPYSQEDVSMDGWVSAMDMFYSSREWYRNVPKENVPLYRSMNDPQFDYVNIKSMANREIHSPPVYYFIAGQWYNLGNIMGIKDGKLLYWIRFLNVAVMGALVWLSYRYCNYFFDKDINYRLGVPMMLATFPNDVFYFITSDVFSPLFCLLTLHMLYKGYVQNQSALFYYMTGLMAATSMLVKLTNIVVIVFLVLFIGVVIFCKQANNDARKRRKNLIITLCSAFFPLALWMGWNLYALGDFTGDSYKIQVLGWSRKPFSTWINHPLFSWDGVGDTFNNLKELIHTFWRGEVNGWHGKSIITPFGEWFYLGTTVLFMSAGIGRLASNRKDITEKSSYSMFSGAIILFLYVGLLLFLSIQFDFGSSMAPSSGNPYFNKGRLIIGGLVPFLIIYISGLDYILKKLKLKIPTLGAVGCICLITLALPIASYWELFKSEWNWFHLFL